MLMNETEAKAKWCPFARGFVRPAADDSPVTVNRAWDGKAEVSCKCITTACMAWEWSDPERWIASGGESKRKTVAATVGEGDERRWAVSEDVFGEGVKVTVNRREEVGGDWTLEELSPNDILYWVEPEAERVARLAEAERTWPERRRGFCSLMEPRS